MFFRYFSHLKKNCSIIFQQDECFFASSLYEKCSSNILKKLYVFSLLLYLKKNCLNIFEKDECFIGPSILVTVTDISVVRFVSSWTGSRLAGFLRSRCAKFKFILSCIHVHKCPGCNIHVGKECLRVYCANRFRRERRAWNAWNWSPTNILPQRTLTPHA